MPDSGNGGQSAKRILSADRWQGLDIAAVANSPALKSVGHRQCATLVRLQSNFLCQHNVACDEITFGHEAPTNSRTAGAIDLMDVHRGAVGNSVSLSALAACNVEVFVRVVLREFLGR